MPTTFVVAYRDTAWTFCHDHTGYYATDNLGNRREFASADDIRAMCQYYLQLGWQPVKQAWM